MCMHMLHNASATSCTCCLHDQYPLCSLHSLFMLALSQPHLQHFNSMYAVSYVMEDNQIKCSRGRVKQAPCLYNNNIGLSVLYCMIKGERSLESLRSTYFGIKDNVFKPQFKAISQISDTKSILGRVCNTHSSSENISFWI